MLASVLPFNAEAWEADVHFGLTRWLAVQAGFSAPQADAIATGNQRVDFGAMETMLLVTEYACTGADAEGRAEAARAARLRLWRLHDHGTAAALAHAPSALTRAQLQRVDALARDRSAYARYPRLADAFFPLMAIESYAPPLLPYIVRPLPALADDEPRMLAIAKLRHAPYDELLLVAQRRAGGWSVVSLQGLRDH